MNISSVPSLPESSSPITRIQITGRSSHACGYCSSKEQKIDIASPSNTSKLENNSISYGCISEIISVEDYQSMMLIGWRRSGNYFYKPCMYETCCPQYTIRLNVNNFRATKSQKKVLKNMNKYLSENTYQHGHQPHPPVPPPILDSIYTNINNNKISNDIKVKRTNENVLSNESSISIQLEKSSFTDEKFALYKKYQVDVHKDDPHTISPNGFKRFLVDSPLVDTTTASSNEQKVVTSTALAPTIEVVVLAQQSISSHQSLVELQYGTFHQLYRLHNELIAVGVIDILPTGVSSVYLFYDNKYRHLVLGKYTALQEINFCMTHNLPYYYMGFYIHTCEKMKYKAEYGPSELLCPTTLTWFPLVDCLPLLDNYQCFSPFDPHFAALLKIKLTNHHHHKQKSVLDLSEFAPQFNQSKDISLVPLDLSKKTSSSTFTSPILLYINDLTRTGFEILKPILTEWLDNVGPQIGQKLVISLR